MKRIVLIGAAALLTAGCASPRLPQVAMPQVRLPAKVNNPIEVASAGSYKYAGKNYRRWREDWIAPPGFAARAWTPGETVPSQYLDGRFTIQWNLRRLPFPGEERQWVRVGKDALLVDKSGRVDLVIERFYF